MKSWVQFLFAISLIIFTVSTFAADGKPTTAYGRVVVFGDSLSDVGTYAGIASFRGGGKFTTNPGKIWAEIVAQQLGLGMKPNRHEGFGLPLVEVGGFNYAQGGSRVVLARHKAATEVETLTARPIAEQVGLFLTKYRKFNSDDLVLVQGGANDIFTNLNLVKDRQLTPQQAIANVSQAGEDLSVIVGNIRNSGAVKIVVINLPAIEKTPRVLTLDENSRKLVATMVAAFNEKLLARTIGLDILAVDFYTFDVNFNEDSSRLGFKDITHAACAMGNLPTRTSLFCNAKSLVEPGADLKYKYADEMHPTTGYSKQVADFIYSQLLRY